MVVFHTAWEELDCKCPSACERGKEEEDAELNVCASGVVGDNAAVEDDGVKTGDEEGGECIGGGNGEGELDDVNPDDGSLEGPATLDWAT